MKNIPLFTTEFGAASLILREIPYKQVAYVHLMAVQPGHLSDLARECREFCRSAGAQWVYLSGPELEDCPWPLHTEILTMTCPRQQLVPGDGALFPVLPENVARYRELYNKAMAPVPNAATMTQADEAQLLSEGGGYFVHWEGTLLGLGQIVGGELRAVISQAPGRGETVLRTLAEAAQEDSIYLHVASANTRALRLYTRLGFLVTGVKSRWYRILPE